MSSMLNYSTHKFPISVCKHKRLHLPYPSLDLSFLCQIHSFPRYYLEMPSGPPALDALSPLGSLDPPGPILAKH
jgi:hypothetical protein